MFIARWYLKEAVGKHLTVADRNFITTMMDKESIESHNQLQYPINKTLIGRLFEEREVEDLRSAYALINRELESSDYGTYSKGEASNPYTNLLFNSMEEVLKEKLLTTPSTVSHSASRH